MTDSIAILATHVARTLPDSLVERKKVLVALSRVLKSSHRAYRPVLNQIAAIEAIEAMQTQLPLNFTNGGGL